MVLFCFCCVAGLTSVCFEFVSGCLFVYCGVFVAGFGFSLGFLFTYCLLAG